MKPSVNICFFHRVIFESVIESLRYGLSQAGYQVTCTPGELSRTSTNIVVGSSTLGQLQRAPDDTIIFNLEQLGSNSPHGNDTYLKLLGKFAVWDYSDKNISFLRDKGIYASKIVFGYCPTLERIEKPSHRDIDILFYGSINSRRAYVLHKLKEIGMNLVVISGKQGVFGRSLDALIARSKLVLNLHYYENNILEVVRVAYLFNNRTAVVCERNKETEVPMEYENVFIGSEYVNLATRCREMIVSDQWVEQEETSFLAFRGLRAIKIVPSIFLGLAACR